MNKNLRYNITLQRALWIVCMILSMSACSSNGTLKQSEEAAMLDTLYYPLDSIDSNGYPIHVCASEDGNMKFYSWNAGTGGTCPDFSILCQFRTHTGESKIIDVSNHSDIGWVSRVHSIKRNDGSTYYLAVSFHQASSNDGYAWVSAFKIDDSDTIRQVCVVDATPLDDQDENEFTVNYSIYDWLDATTGEGYDWILEYDPDIHDLYVPQTLDTSPFPEMSDWYRVYHFNGKKFVDKGIKAHKGLHRSLCDYDHLERYFRTKWHIIRIDRLKDGTLRYASWKASSNISDKPELVIMGGKCDKSEFGKGIYTFENDGVTYIAGYEETKHINKDEIEYHEYLLIKRGNKTIDKQEILGVDND